METGKNFILGTIGTFTSAVGTAVQPNEILETISLIITIIGAIISFIIIPLINWWHKIREDGKITGDELKEGIDIIENGVSEVQETAKGEKK